MTHTPDPHCTICTTDQACAGHRWTARYGDDIRNLRREIDAGEIDFAQLEMVS